MAVYVVHAIFWSSVLLQPHASIRTAVHSVPSLDLNTYDNSSSSLEWRSTSPFRPVRNTSYGSIRLRHSMSLSLTLTWHGLSSDAPSDPYEGILRIGTPSDSTRDCNGHATRYPALYLDRQRGAIQFALSNDIDCWGVGLLNTSLKHLQRERPYAIRVEYNASRVRIEVDHATLFDGARRGSTPPHMLDSLAAVMISDSIDHAANVTLSDIVIRSYDDVLSEAPTPSPTQPPTLVLLEADIVIDAVYIDEGADEEDHELMHPKVIEKVFASLLPMANHSVLRVNLVEIDAAAFNVSLTASVRGHEALDELVAFIAGNLTVDVVEQALPASSADVDIAVLRHAVSVDGVVVSEGVSQRTTPAPIFEVDEWQEAMDSLPFGHLAVYILMAAMVLFVCSALISIATICYFCRMHRRGRAHKYCHTHRLDGVDASDEYESNSRRGHKRRRTQSLDCEHEYECDDGPEAQTQRLATSVRSPLPQYQRVHSNLPAMDEELELDVARASVDLDQLAYAVAYAVPALADKRSVQSASASAGLRTLDELAQQSEMRSDLMEKQLLTNRLADACEREEQETDDSETAHETDDESHEAMYDEGFDDAPTTRTNTMDTGYGGASGGRPSRHPSYF